MKFLSPTQHKRLNEVTGFLLLSLGLVILLSLVSYHAQDPSWDTASDSRPLNLIGYPGAYFADLAFQVFGMAAFLFPLLTLALSWRWIRSEPLEAGAVKTVGSVLLTLGLCAGLSCLPLRIFGGTIRIGGTLGFALWTYLVNSLNIAGALVATGTAIIVSVYLVSTFTLAKLGEWFAGPEAWFGRRAEAWRAWRERVHQRSVAKAQERALKRFEKTQTQRSRKKEKTVAAADGNSLDRAPWHEPEELVEQPPAEPLEGEPGESEYASIEEIPICEVADLPPVPPPIPIPDVRPALPEPKTQLFHLPATDLLNEVPTRSQYDEQELKDTAAKIKSKFEEFSVLGNVVQINPGPVVTTFEFKPEAGIKYTPHHQSPGGSLPGAASRIDPD